MTRRMYWGLAILIVLLIGVSAVLLMRNTDTEPINVYRGDTEPLNPNPTLNTKDNPLPAEPEDEPQNETVSSEEAEEAVSDDVQIVANDVLWNEAERLMDKYNKTLDDLTSEDLPVGDLDMSNPNLTRWIQKHSKAANDRMSAARLLMETGGSTTEEFMTKVDNMTDKERKELVELMINRMKASQAAIEAYIEVSRERPVK